ncbi:MAG TPA: hypothetical protein VEC99_00680 [Clostridia bacterium]|nr:hypothetical protein [Clostridia bacterium]
MVKSLLHFRATACLVLAVFLAGVNGSAQILYFGESPLFVVNTASARVDTDNDGMPDHYEVMVGLNPQIDDGDQDPDGDGFTNLQEYGAGTSPFEVDAKQVATGESGLFAVNTAQIPLDSDRDGLPDWWELQHGLDLAQNDAQEDPDRDGLSNLDEFNSGNDPRSDDVGSSSAVSLLFAVNTSAYSVPVETDSDGDGIPDWWEQKYGFNPVQSDSDIDSDNDGLSNFAEYRQGTDPTRDESRTEVVAMSALFTLDTVGAPPDTDVDGMRDYWETAMGLDPKRADANEDPDSDGRTNLEEYNAGTDPLVDDWRGPSLAVSSLFLVDTGGLVGPHNMDSDGDGIPDWWEVLHGLNKDLVDTAGDPDRDGRTNLEEYNAGSDPFVPDNRDIVFAVSGTFLVDTGGRYFDTDGDGMPDWWEKLYFNDPRGTLALVDADGDGLSNLAEFLAGSDPLDPQSVFRIVQLETKREAQGVRVSVRWASFEGGVYSIWVAEAPEGPYSAIATNLTSELPTGRWDGVVPETKLFLRVRTDSRSEP